MGSIKNTRVRTKDIKSGKVLYVAHPIYGIEIYKVTSKPYMESGIGLFFRCKRWNSTFNCWGDTCESLRSLRDCGISAGESRNGRRTFFKLKQAISWNKHWIKNKQFIANHNEHIGLIRLGGFIHEG